MDASKCLFRSGRCIVDLCSVGEEYVVKEAVEEVLMCGKEEGELVRVCAEGGECEGFGLSIGGGLCFSSIFEVQVCDNTG